MTLTLQKDIRSSRLDNVIHQGRRLQQRYATVTAAAAVAAAAAAVLK